MWAAIDYSTILIEIEIEETGGAAVIIEDVPVRFLGKNLMRPVVDREIAALEILPCLRNDRGNILEDEIIFVDAFPHGATVEYRLYGKIIGSDFGCISGRRMQIAKIMVVRCILDPDGRRAVLPLLDD